MSNIYSKLIINRQKKLSCTSLANISESTNRPYLLENREETKMINLSDDAMSVHDSSDVMDICESKDPKQLTIFGSIDVIDIPAECPKPIPFVAHHCQESCLYSVRHVKCKLNNAMNTLSIPLHFGFERLITKLQNSQVNSVTYKSPCGLIIENEKDMYNYLRLTTEFDESILTIDVFSFDPRVNPLALFRATRQSYYMADLSCGKEFKPISVVNYLNDSKTPPMEYIIKRKFQPEVEMNINKNFLCGCDCIDDCNDKTKCSCWKLTYEYQKNFPLSGMGPSHSNHSIGYNNKRLYNAVTTGIYECNVNCQCKNTCLNRVVQAPLSTMLQVFLTDKKGWGVRTLADIPEGAYICSYIGEINTESVAEMNGLKYGDEYLADLDCIESIEEMKEDYESCAYDSDIYMSDSSDSDSDIEEQKQAVDEFKPSSNLKNQTFEPRKSLRINLQNANKKEDGNHQPSKLNVNQGYETPFKSLRSYLDEDSGVYVMDAKASGNVGRYLNHSCNPNLFIQNVFVDTHDLRFPWLTYFASTYIPAGTELTWNYLYHVGSVKNKVIKCHCGSKNCKGRLL